MSDFFQPCRTCYSQWKLVTISKRSQSRYDKALKNFQEGIPWAPKPKKLIPHRDKCPKCDGKGIIESENFPAANPELPHIAIIGWGIAGMALAIACLHRWIPYSLFERDTSFDARAQWYGLTLQQASKAMESLGIPRFEKGITSVMHIVHNETGKIIGQWGRRNVDLEKLEKNTKRRNIHVPRQVLRQDLYDALARGRGVSWGNNLQNIKKNADGTFSLVFEVDGKTEIHKADLIVWADGIRSQVRNIFLPQDISPLRYLGCIVILGICPRNISGLWVHPLLDNETIFQSVNGHERIYMMPFDFEHIMWQMSFQVSEDEAKKLNKAGSEALRQEWLRRLWDWHSPIPEILEATDSNLITGYPVYDRQELTSENLKDFWNVTLIGDAMHPMSPFKGQGANQAILDSLDLARSIYELCAKNKDWREYGLRKLLLTDFESRMITRTTPKVQDSARQAKLLHSDAVLHDGDMPRGRGIWGENEE